MDREKLLSWIDHFTLFCFCVLVIFLPIRETETIRAFSMGIPLGLWIIKMIIQRKWLIQRTPLDIPILLFTLVAAVSLITAVDFWYSADEFQGDWLTGIVLFYLVVNNFREEQLKYLLGALLLGNLLMVSYGIYDFFHRGGSLFTYQVRAGSLHSGFGTFGTYLITILPYLLIPVFIVRRISNRLTLLCLLLLNFFALYLTHSRGSWIAATILLLLAGWRFLPKKILIVSTATAAVLFFFLAPQTIIKHHAGVISSGAPPTSIETGQARWELIKFSLEKIKESPFQMLGFGRRSFVKKYQDFYLRYKGALLWHGHNTFLNIAFQTGLQGLAIFCFLIYKLIKYCHQRANFENSLLPKYFLLATLLMVITFLVRNLSDDFFIDDSALLFWFLSGAAVSLRRG
ncbi:MAG: O-antigen ligase family protein [Thermodesulfobacteriota bacterium]|jgi:O-antigen ligase